ncbi:MAG: very short patch repair endonuclease [Streptosporangiaceae bacterium]
MATLSVVLQSQGIHPCHQAVAGYPQTPEVDAVIVWPVDRTTQSWASSPRSRNVMRGNRSRDTRPELAVRSAVHRRGLRYRVSIRPVPEVRRTADLVFATARVAVFVDGCYWHGCPEHYVPSLSNQEYWTQKISGNRARDADTNAKLLARDWMPLRVWAHEDPDDAADRILKIVRDRTADREKMKVYSSWVKGMVC